MTIEEACDKLYKEGHRDQIQAVGIGLKDGQPCIHVYVMKKSKGWPETYEGYPIDVHKSGKIRPAGEAS